MSFLRVAFLLPALFISSPIAPKYSLSVPSFDLLLRAIVLVSIAAIGILTIVGTDVKGILVQVANALVPGSGG